MSKEKAKPKIGAGHAKAMGRLGLSELRGALYNQSNVAQPSQYGLYGTSTPGEVEKDRKGEGLDRNEEPSPALEERLKPGPGERETREPDSREIERD